MKEQYGKEEHMDPFLKDTGEGLCLRVLPTDRFKIGMLSLSAALPITKEETPLTSLLLSVLRRGTEKYPTLEAINRRLDYLYGAELATRNFYRGNVQIIGITAELLDASYLSGEDPTPEVLDVVDQILFHPLLDEKGYLLEKYVESEKKMQCDQIRALKNNPRAYAANRMQALVYGGESCGQPIYGTVEQVMAVTPAQLTEHWRKLLSVLTLDCFYVGAANPDRLLACLRQSVGASLTAASSRVLPAIASPVSAPTDVQEVCEELEAGQSQLLLAYRSEVIATSPQFAACMLLNELLGASPVSRLFTEVRERLSLCYSCSSVYLGYKGILRVSCGLHRDNRELAEREIKRQVALLQSGDFSDGELEAAKRSLAHSYRQLSDSPSALENYHYGRALLNSALSPTEQIERICAVTRADVIAAANTFALHTVYFLKGTLDGEEDADDEN